MTKHEMYQLMNNNPAFWLATAEGVFPHVRGMLLYRADKNGIFFHTASSKDLYKQILQNSNVELCFLDSQSHVQLRVSGTLDFAENRELKDEIINHPSRSFLTSWKASISAEEFYESFIVLRMCGGRATLWSMETNFAKKEFFDL